MPRLRVKRIIVYLDCRWMAAGGCLQVSFDRYDDSLLGDERVYVPGPMSVNRVEALLNAHQDVGKEMIDQLVQDVRLTMRRVEVVFDVRRLQGKRITE